ALSSNRYQKVGGQDDLKSRDLNRPGTLESRSNRATNTTGIKETRKNSDRWMSSIR
ncbi:hypothetical protein A2U01_0109300, partial [Trifolium medium]|nr:hypothetical protein [Trifolium medium]